MNVAKTYEEWQRAAVQQDAQSGMEQWKLNPVHPDYDYRLLSRRLDAMRKARKEGDLQSMLFLLRTSLLRNLADMGTASLYNTTAVGTKKLIEDYIVEVIEQLNQILHYPSSQQHKLTVQSPISALSVKSATGGISTMEEDDLYSVMPQFNKQSPEVGEHEVELDVTAKLALFQNIRQLQGRTALLLSGGATLGLLHIGVVKALLDLNLLPRIISGSSIGSMIAALVCTKEDDEMRDFLNKEMFQLQALESAEEEGSLLVKLNRFIKHGVFFDVEVLKKSIRENIGDVTFQEAYNRTRRILNITVSSSTKYEMPRLLNYLTAPDVLIWSAVCASCAIPFIYKSAPLVSRDASGNTVSSGHLWIDGSVENDLPMTRLSEMLNVNHFIVSQVNPHVAPILSRIRDPNKSSWLSTAFRLATSEVQHRISQLIELDIFPTTLHHFNNILAQKYHGDITIVPDLRLQDYAQLISNPTRESLWDAILRGERATWRQISIIRNHCQVEIYLDECIYQLRIQKLEQDWKVAMAEHGGKVQESHQTMSPVRTGTLPSSMLKTLTGIENSAMTKSGVEPQRNIHATLPHKTPLSQMFRQQQEQQRIRLPFGMQMSTALVIDEGHEQPVSAKTAPVSPLDSYGSRPLVYLPDYDSSLDHSPLLSTVSSRKSKRRGSVSAGDKFDATEHEGGHHSHQDKMSASQPESAMNKMMHSAPGSTLSIDDISNNNV